MTDGQPDRLQDSRSDALELLHCFGEVPISIESHVKSAKGKADFWEAIATNRAELVRPSFGVSAMVQNTVKLHRAQGHPGGEGYAVPSSDDMEIGLTWL